MKRLLKIVGGLVAVVFVGGTGTYIWASVATARTLARTFGVHAVEFPIPFPLSDEERAELDLTEEDAAAMATNRAVERGQHLVEARYGCTECHGSDFSGGVMVDAFPLGRLLGPNLTSGEGSRTLSYTSVDWDRMVRHGVRPDSRSTAMPSVDFELMSDQELSDIVAYIETMPPVDNVVPPVTLGPLGKILVATGALPLAADLIERHDADHLEFPPTAEVSIAFGQHLAAVCTGCHTAELAGGPIPGGDPSWGPAANLTPHAEGLGSWSYDDFVIAMREGRGPDGVALLTPMDLMVPYATEMTEVEMEALWTYLQSVPPVASR
jgi:mono/diheme cytochrome c family protein